MIEDYIAAYKYFSKPPNVENTYLPHPINNNKSIELGVFNEHRFAFYFWAKWRMSNNNNSAPALITFDWHQDLAYPEHLEKEWMRKLDLKNLFEVSFYSWAKLSPLNDNHILSAAYLNLIGDIFVVCKDFSCSGVNEIEEIIDINNNKHIIRKFDSIESLLALLVASDLQEVLFDIDLDYFTVENISSNDKQLFSYMPDKTIKELLNPKSQLMSWILNRITGFTIALEPEHCGGIQRSLKYYSLLEKILFTGSIYNDQTLWR